MPLFDFIVSVRHFYNEIYMCTTITIEFVCAIHGVCVLYFFFFLLVLLRSYFYCCCGCVSSSQKLNEIFFPCVTNTHIHRHRMKTWCEKYCLDMFWLCVRGDRIRMCMCMSFLFLHIHTDIERTGENWKRRATSFIAAKQRRLYLLHGQRMEKERANLMYRNVCKCENENGCGIFFPYKSCYNIVAFDYCVSIK